MVFRTEPHLFLMFMQLTKELFVIPEDNSYILYAPLKGAVMRVNAAAISLLKKIQSGDDISGLEDKITPFFTAGIIVDEELEENRFFRGNIDFSPTSVTLMPTTDCNLRCVYCYGNGGLNPTYMDTDIAFASIDLIIENALKKGMDKVSIGFHGGGEPLLWKIWELISSSVAYAKSKTLTNRLSLNVTAASNGILNMEQLQWIKNNLDHINISLDGPEEIQNMQRPTIAGTGSFHLVMKTIEFLETNCVSYGIRATVTEESVLRMREIIDLVRERTTLKKVHLEPLFECGRCYMSGYKSPDSIEFIKQFLQTYEKARNAGISIHYSGGRFGSLTDKFCGAVGRNFGVTSEGFVTSCYEVVRSDDHRRDIFFYGYYDRDTQRFIIDIDKLKHLASRTVENIPYCSDCFAKYNCAGDCLAKAQTSSGDMFNPEYDSRCSINQAVLLNQIQEKLC